MEHKMYEVWEDQQNNTWNVQFVKSVMSFKSKEFAELIASNFRVARFFYDGAGGKFDHLAEMTKAQLELHEIALGELVNKLKEEKSDAEMIVKSCKKELLQYSQEMDMARKLLKQYSKIVNPINDSVCKACGKVHDCPGAYDHVFVK